MIPRGERYSRGAIAFHWAIAALVLFNLWLGLAHDYLPREWKVMPVHRSVGITVLALSLARLGWRLAHRPPPLPAAMPGWEKTAAKAMHRGFYALTIALPLTGWLWSSDPEKLRVIRWFFLFDLPVLPSNHALSSAMHETHEVLGITMAALVAIHIAAALRHHFVLRDSVLRRMLPGMRGRG